jgi:hypothetical protein
MRRQPGSAPAASTAAGAVAGFRLSRSLLDFAKLMEILDRHQICALCQQ